MNEQDQLVALAVNKVLPDVEALVQQKKDRQSDHSFSLVTVS
jgi:N-acetylmuramic acid 6-phosphate (MurNAc-6-P) etherase